MVNSQIYYLIELCVDISAIFWLYKNQVPLILNSMTGEYKYIGLYKGSLFLFSFAFVLLWILYPLPLIEKVEKGKDYNNG